MYDHVKELMGKNGYEHQRVGGSSGKIEVSQDFRKFISPSSRKNNYPRFVSSLKFLPSKDNLKWEVYYIGVKDLEPKKSYCCNIVKGGAFIMPIRTMEIFPFLQEFLATKAKAALLLYEINGATKGHKIQPKAVKQEISNLKTANRFDWELMKTEFLEDITGGRRIGIKKEFVMKYFSTMNRHTLVQHCVGFHLDNIKDQPVLENKMSFKLPSKSMLGQNGRCGAGPNHFVFALLDWPKKNNIRTSTYRALGGNRIIGERLTEYNWTMFRTLFRIPDVEDDVRADEDGVMERIDEARQIMREEQMRNPNLQIE